MEAACIEAVLALEKQEWIINRVAVRKPNPCAVMYCRNLGHLKWLHLHLAHCLMKEYAMKLY